VTFINRAGREKWGYPAGAGAGPVSALDLVHPDERPRIQEIYTQAFSGKYLPVHEVTARKSDGSTFPMEVYLTPIVKKKKVKGLRVLCIDISRSKILQDRLVQANAKLNRMCQITRHDFNNKVTALRGYLDLAQEHAGNDEVGTCLQKIGAIVGILETQVQFTKSYQEIGQFEPKWQVLADVLAQSRAAFAFGDIDPAIAVQGVEVYADLLLEKVFYNLFDNSLSHGEQVTSVSISCRRNDRSLEIVYEDNGTGITAEDKPHLFTCGFGKHTGLGLFLSKEILATTGITIAETGEPGKGARFEINVPEGSYRFMKGRTANGNGKVTS
jgi:PAS domain S-box-containing protein